MSHREIAKRLAITAAALIALASAARAEDVQLTFWNGFTGPDRPAIESITTLISVTAPATTRVFRNQRGNSAWVSIWT